ncbi:MAG: hypothetical protein D4R80_08470 [Deltaproteobacteria bacterium]|nr:MAG: hypothetical protein D4R80_08470 [Deltaproteobacteria bacterium]
MKRLIGGLFAAFALLIGATIYISFRSWDGLVDRPSSETAGTLRAAMGGQEILLSIAPWPPPTMREVDFTVSLPGTAGKDAPYVDLSMAGMEMGRNRVDLSRGADGRYRGTGVFVRCPSGRRDWEATVTAPGAGKAVFRFAVAD